MNDATFAFMLGISVYALWYLLDDPWLAILPALFMAYGDGKLESFVTKCSLKEQKSAWGNLGMAILCIPLGYIIGNNSDPSIPVWGAFSGAIASFVERYEFGPIDDNVLIVVASSVLIALGVHWPTSLNIKPIQSSLIHLIIINSNSKNHAEQFA